MRMERARGAFGEVGERGDFADGRFGKGSERELGFENGGEENGSSSSHGETREVRV